MVSASAKLATPARSKLQAASPPRSNKKHIVPLPNGEQQDNDEINLNQSSVGGESSATTAETEGVLAHPSVMSVATDASHLKDSIKIKGVFKPYKGDLFGTNGDTANGLMYLSRMAPRDHYEETVSYSVDKEVSFNIGCRASIAQDRSIEFIGLRLFELCYHR
jgi:hypothetical protein